MTSLDGDSTDDVTHSRSHMRPQVRHKKSQQTCSVLHWGSVESDSESTVPQKPKSKMKNKRSALQSAPKLFYDGKEEWEIFQEEFQDYAEQMDWSPTECKACLKWCLRGKASKFCNALLKTHEDISYKRLLKKLADRFGDDDFRAAAVSKFNQANQKKDEILDDWADCVRDLAAKAFRAVSEVYCQEQAVQKFCKNVLDNEVCHNILLQVATTLEQAMKRVRLFQHTKNACYKKKLDQGCSCRITAENYKDVRLICAVKGQPDMSAILKEMAEQRQILDNWCCVMPINPHSREGAKGAPMLKAMLLLP